MSYCVTALYHFTRLADYEQLKAPLQNMCELLGIKGTLPVSYTHLTLPTTPYV